MDETSADVGEELQAAFSQKVTISSEEIPQANSFKAEPGEDWQTELPFPNNDGVAIAYVLLAKEVVCKRERIEQLLWTLGFKCAKYIDQEMDVRGMNMFLSAIRMANFKDYRCFLLLIISHGAQGKIRLNDKEHYFSHDRIMHFVAENQSLSGIPKWFIFASCQGKIRMPGSSCELGTLTDNLNLKGEFRGLPLYQDMLVTYGSVPGFLTTIDLDYGCVMLRHLHEVVQFIRNKNKSAEITNVLTKLHACSSWKYCNTQPPEYEKFGCHTMPAYLSSMTKSMNLSLRPEFQAGDIIATDDPAAEPAKQLDYAFRRLIAEFLLQPKAFQEDEEEDLKEHPLGKDALTKMNELLHDENFTNTRYLWSYLEKAVVYFNTNPATVTQSMPCVAPL